MDWFGGIVAYWNDWFSELAWWKWWHTRIVDLMD
jgi:hypothetical protein